MGLSRPKNIIEIFSLNLLHCVITREFMIAPGGE